MEILHTRCAGIDVHKKNVKVCLIITEENGKQKKEIRTYSTMTPQLLELHDWLKEQGCSHIAFEATGVYWKPVFNLFEGQIQVLVVNAQHIKAVPGRKTDVKDGVSVSKPENCTLRGTACRSGRHPGNKRRDNWCPGNSLSGASRCVAKSSCN